MHNLLKKTKTEIRIWRTIQLHTYVITKLTQNDDTIFHTKSATKLPDIMPYKCLMMH